MAQINIYVPDAIARAIRAQARKQRKSLSQYVVTVLQGQVGATGWQKDFFTSVVGGWKGGLEPVPRPPAEDRPGL